MSDTLSWKPPDYSDAGNAVILVNECHGLLAFCDALGWLSWAGTHWEQNEHQAIGRAVKLTENMIIDDMAPAINELSDRGYIRRLEDDVGYNNRKQSKGVRNG